MYEIAAKGRTTVGELLQAAGGSPPVHFCALLWLCKAGLLVIDGFATEGFWQCKTCFFH